MFCQREISSTIIELLKEFPVVAILGARQVGKTTLAKDIIKNVEKKPIYLDMELPTDLNKLTDPELYLKKHQEKLVIIDEIQRLPNLFPLLRALIDVKRVNGRFLILGSANVELLRQSSETLAGRIYYKTLEPFNVLEVEDQERLWFRGGFPMAYLSKTDRAALRWLNAFIQTYIERDLPMLNVQVPPLQLRQFWEMLAHANGQCWNSSRFASNFGISPHTIKRYLSILENTFLVRQIYPYFGNVNKRLVKAPKIYIRDTGLLHGLLNIHSMESLLGHPILGASYEGWIIEQICSGINDDFTKFYYYRTHAGAEADLVIEQNRQRILVEIKRNLSPKVSRGLLEVKEDLKAEQAYIIYPGEETYPLKDNIIAIPLMSFLKKFKKEQ